MEKQIGQIFNVVANTMTKYMETFQYHLQGGRSHTMNLWQRETRSAQSFMTIKFICFLEATLVQGKGTLRTSPVPCPDDDNVTLI